MSETESPFKKLLTFEFSPPRPRKKKAKPKKKKTRVTEKRLAGKDHAVVSVSGGDPKAYRREPCDECPWRTDIPKVFPSEAFRLSAHTAYDMADRTFACHMSGTKSPSTCAGFLLKNSRNNMQVRISVMKGELNLRKVKSSVPLFESYRAMAIANGVSPDDPALQHCRDDDDLSVKTPLRLKSKK